MVNKSFDQTFSYAPLFQNLEKLGLTVYDLRRKENVSESVIINLLEGRPVLISTLCKIALLLGLELNDIVSLDHDWKYDQAKELRRQLLC